MDQSKRLKYCVDLRLDGLVSVIVAATNKEEAGDLAMAHANKHGLPVEDLLKNPSFHVGIASINPVRQEPPNMSGLDVEYKP